MTTRTTYECQLTPTQREDLAQMVSKGVHRAREITRARILLMCDLGPDGLALGRAEVARLLGVHPGTVTKTIKRLVQGGLEDAVCDRPRSGQPLKLTPKVQAQITAIACQHPPQGQKHWTLALIRDQLLLMNEELESLGVESVRKVLKKTDSNLG